MVFHLLFSDILTHVRIDKISPFLSKDERNTWKIEVNNYHIILKWSDQVRKFEIHEKQNGIFVEIR
jgi:hypothetical protein